ncbi:haloacid dehalogenase, partial [Pleomassaria siparia CBS 279.74]
MHPIQHLSRKKNLLLALDAFKTLYRPNSPIPTQYARIGMKYGVLGHRDEIASLRTSFKHAFEEQSSTNPNYGKATGLGAENWWANVIKSTFNPFLKSGQKVPQAMVSELLTCYSTSEGYKMYHDVMPFFNMLRERKTQANLESPWKWDKTVVGIVTNSDDRVPGILESFGLRVGTRRVGVKTERSARANLDDDISFVVMSYDVGFEKPDRRIFQAAEAMLKETLAEDGEGVEEQAIGGFEMLYVGDSFEKDYLGAKDSGWEAVMVDRAG